MQHLAINPLVRCVCGLKTFVGFIKCRWKCCWLIPCEFTPLACKLFVFLWWTILLLVFFMCIISFFVFFAFDLTITIAMAILVAMASNLAPPKGFKFHRFFSIPNSNIANINQMPPVDIVVSSTLEDSVQPITFIDEKSIVLGPRVIFVETPREENNKESRSWGTDWGKSHESQPHPQPKRENFHCNLPFSHIVSKPKWVSVWSEIRRKSGFSLPSFFTYLFIIDYEQKYVWFEIRKLENNPRHHWSDTNGWEMAHAIER